MQVTIELPDVIAAELKNKWGDLPRGVLEAVAVDGFRKGELTDRQAMTILGYRTNAELESLLSRASIGLDAPATASLAASTTPEEWVQSLRKWASQQERGKPGLSDEALTRESIYFGEGRFGKEG